MTILAYPFLFGILPILTIYGASPGFWILPELLQVLGVVCILIALFIVIIGIMLRDFDKAAVISSLLATLFFCFSLFKTVINQLLVQFTFNPAPSWVALAIYLLVWAPFVCLFAKSDFRFGKHIIPINLKSARPKLNLLAAFLVGITIYQIVGLELHKNSVNNKITVSEYWRDKKIQIRHAQSQPDIYYIIVDGYANAETFSQYYNYDNSAFIRFLKTHGFYVASHSCSNHDRTCLSIPSSLNMQYLTHLTSNREDAYSTDKMLHNLLENNQTIHLLRNQGYKFVNLCTLFPLTAFIRNADFNISCSVNGNFSLVILGLSIFSEFEPQFHFRRDQYAQSRLCMFHKVHELKEIVGPKFVFVHCLLTHPPFIFNSKGERLPVPLEHLNLSEAYDPHGYIEQVKFAEMLLKPFIYDLLNQNPKPIVILQSDHGPATIPEAKSTSSFAMQYKYINARMRILNAYFFPEGGKIKPYQSISPVNTFRLILNGYFSTHLDMLPDESFLSFADEQQFRFRNVTKHIEFKEEN